MLASIKATYNLTADEFVEAQRGYRSRIARSRWAFNATPLVGGALIVLVFVTGPHQQYVWPAVGLMLGVGLLLYRATWSSRKRRAFEDSDLPKGRSLEADDAGLRIDRDFGGTAISWASFRKVYETSHLFLLFLTTNLFSVVPKRAFTAGDLVRFRDLVQQKVPSVRRKTGALATGASLFLLWAVAVVVFGGLAFNLISDKISKVTASGQTYRKRKPVPEKAAALESLHPSAKVYFVPLDEPSQRLMNKLVPYYENKYGLAIQVLPTLPYEAWTDDPSRHQAIADELVAEIRHAYPEIVNNSHNAMVALTSRDMYMLDRTWDFTYNLREDERIAVVSSGRADPTYFKKAADERLLETRVRKLITKNLGIICFNLELSGNPYSVLYYDFDGPEDVDTASEDYLQSDAERYDDPRWQSGDPCLIIRHYHDDDRKRLDTASLETCDFSTRMPGLETFQVDLRYGMLIDQRTDFFLPGTLPIDVTRVYRTQDSRSRAFGTGASHSLNIFPVGDKWPFSFIDLILAGGYHVHYRRKSFGLSYWDAVYRTRDGSLYDGSEIRWNWPGWKLTLGNGTTYFFPPGDKAQRGEQAALNGVKDMHGNVLKLVRQPSGDLLSVASSNHRLDFSYDDHGHITRAQDEQGHAFSYRYDGDHLVEVHDDQGRDVEYSWDSKGQMLEASEYHSRVIFNAAYEREKVERLSLENGRMYRFEYQQDAQGNVLEAKVFDGSEQIALVKLRPENDWRGFVIRWLTIAEAAPGAESHGKTGPSGSSQTAE